jgi:hypothetical protein
MLRGLVLALMVSGCVAARPARVRDARDGDRRSACRAGFALAFEHARDEPVYLDALDNCTDVLGEIAMSTIETIYTEWWRYAHTLPDRYRCPGSRATGVMCGPTDGGTVVRVERVEPVVASAARTRLKPIDGDAGVDVSCDESSQAKGMRVWYSWRRYAGGGSSTLELACRGGQWQRVIPRFPLDDQPVL